MAHRAFTLIAGCGGLESGFIFFLPAVIEPNATLCSRITLIEVAVLPNSSGGALRWRFDLLRSNSITAAADGNILLYFSSPAVASCLLLMQV